MEKYPSADIFSAWNSIPACDMTSAMLSCILLFTGFFTWRFHSSMDAVSNSRGITAPRSTDAALSSGNSRSCMSRTW